MQPPHPSYYHSYYGPNHKHLIDVVRLFGDLVISFDMTILETVNQGEI